MHAIVRPLALTLMLGSAPLQAQTLGSGATQPITELIHLRHAWSVVGDPGNPALIPTLGQLGKVDYIYLIGTFEVTNAQYAWFLNTKATPDDPVGLYNTLMSLDPRGGIERSGTGTDADPFHYTLKPFMGNKPVNFVSVFDAMRYANWLHNGMGDADTESGAYLLLGGTPVPTNGNSVVRSPGAKVALPTESEWVKATYYNPALGAYAVFGVGSSIVPTEATAGPTGSISNPGANVANYNNAADWGGLDGAPTTVGSAGPLARSFYGCADLNGNVSEWNETVFTLGTTFYRINRGGDYSRDASIMSSGSFGILTPASEKATSGIRLVRLFP